MQQEATPPPPAAPRRLARSTRDHMWAGVAGGLAEYFDVDPVLARLLWVAAAIFTGGLAVPVYLVLWVVMPRDDQPERGGPGAWSQWSHEFEAETRHFADEARRMAEGVSGQVHGRATTAQQEQAGAEDRPSWTAAHAAETTATGTAAEGAATGKGTAVAPPPPPPWPTFDAPGWSGRYGADAAHHGRRRRSAGVILVALGLIVLAGNVGLFRWIDWHVLWPLVLVCLGVALLFRQRDWRL